MKLECIVVEDFYPLYMENELKPETKEAIDNHLEGCSGCRSIYSEGTGFTDTAILEKEAAPAVPKTVDDRIRLRFRLRRMQAIAVMLAVSIIVYTINSYMDNRKRVAEKFNDVYLFSEELTLRSEDPTSFTIYTPMLSYYQEKMIDFTEDLNWLEQKKLDDSRLYLDTGGLEAMANKLKKRWELGLADETDKKAYAELKMNIDSFHEEVQKQYRLFHHGYSSYFELVDVQKFSTKIENINRTVYFYNRHHAVSTDVKEMGQAPLKKKISSFIGSKIDNVILTKRNDNPSLFDFKTELEGQRIDGQIDSYTGYITAVRINPDETGKFPGESDRKLDEKATEILKRQYGKNSEMLVEEVNSSDRYSYTFTPLNGGYELHFPFELHFYIGFDFASGRLTDIRAENVILTPEFFKFKPNDAIGRERAENIAAKEAGAKGKYNGTEILYSSVEAGYVLAHIFEVQGNTIYINAENGKLVEPYYL